MDDSNIYEAIHGENEKQNKLKNILFVSIPLLITLIFMVMFGLIASTYHSVNSMHDSYYTMKMQHEQLMVENEQNTDVLHQIYEKVNTMEIAMIGICKTFPEYSDYCQIMES